MEYSYTLFSGEAVDKFYPKSLGTPSIQCMRSVQSTPCIRGRLLSPLGSVLRHALLLSFCRVMESTIYEREIWGCLVLCWIKVVISPWPNHTAPLFIHSLIHWFIHSFIDYFSLLRFLIFDSEKKRPLVDFSLSIHLERYVLTQFELISTFWLLSREIMRSSSHWVSIRAQTCIRLYCREITGSGHPQINTVKPLDFHRGTMKKENRPIITHSEKFDHVRKGRNLFN